jgi:predicted nucleotidyltransferase
LAGFRVDPVGAEAVVIGAHRRAEAVLMPYGQWKTLPALPAVPLLDTLRAKGPLIARLAALSHVTSVSVFGSVARRAETAMSDIDLLVDLDDDASLFDLAQFEMDLEAVFDRHVDVVSRGSLTDADSTILREAIPL